MGNSSKKSNNPLITSTEFNSFKDSTEARGVPQDKEWGIDTVTLSIPASYVQVLEKNDWSHVEGKSSYNFDKTAQVSNFSVGYANVRVAYMPIYRSIFMSFNAARLISPKSAELLPPAALKPLVEKLLLGVVPQIPVLPDFMGIDEDGVVEFAPDWDKQVKLTRLDCDRNFLVDCPEYLRHALSHVKGKYQKTVHLYFNHEGWTRANTTESAGMDRIYDKSAELRNLELEERFHWDKRVYRFESQLQRDRLKTFGVTTLDRIDDEAVWNVLERRWDACGWGIELPGQEGGLDELLLSLGEKDRIPFLGFMVATAEGITDKVDSKQRKRLSRIAKDMGLVPGLPVSSYRKMTKFLSLWHGKSVSHGEAAGQSL